MCTKRLFFVLMIVVLLLSPKLAIPLTAQDDQTSLDLVHRYSDELWAGKIALADEILTEDFVAHYSDNPDQNKEVFIRDILGPTASIFYPAPRVIPVAEIVEGNLVAVAQLWGGSSGGKEVWVSNIEFFRIENDKIAELWSSPNSLSLFQQLGWVQAESGVTPEEPWGVTLSETRLTPDQSRALIWFYIQAVNTHHFDRLDDLWIENGVGHWVPLNLTLEGLGAMRVAWAQTSPAHRVALDLLVVADNLAAAHYTIFTEDNGVPIRTNGASLYRFENGKIAEEWAIWDELSVQAQIAAAASAKE